MLGVGMLSIPYALKEVSLSGQVDMTELKSASSHDLVVAGRLGYNWSAWSALDLHKLHWQGEHRSAWYMLLLVF